MARTDKLISLESRVLLHIGLHWGYIHTKPVLGRVRRTITGASSAVPRSPCCRRVSGRGSGAMGKATQELNAYAPRWCSGVIR